VNFGSHTDAVIAAAVGLVNAATPGGRQGQPFVVPTGDALSAAVTVALQQAGRGSTAPAKAQLPAFVELGGAVRVVFEQVSAGDLDAAAGTVNTLLGRYQPSPYLDRHDGQPWHLHFHGNDATDRSGWGGGISVGLATVLGSEYAERLGVCAASGCDRVYVDVSRNGTRRFCSTTCQNRIKAAAHRARSR
jgi:predicted RNA-binding Zn ribbon-like protein